MNDISSAKDGGNITKKHNVGNEHRNNTIPHWYEILVSAVFDLVLFALSAISCKKSNPGRLFKIQFYDDIKRQLSTKSSNLAFILADDFKPQVSTILSYLLYRDDSISNTSCNFGKKNLNFTAIMQSLIFEIWRTLKNCLIKTTKPSKITLKNLEGLP